MCELYSYRNLKFQSDGMTVMSSFPPYSNPSTSDGSIHQTAPPFNAGGSYYSYQQFQAQRSGVQSQWSQNQNQWPPTQKPDPDAYVPQGAANFSQSQTANWVNGPMYGSSAALPSYHGSAAPSVITNMSYRTNGGADTPDNMSTISTMTGYGGQYSSRASTASLQQEKDPAEMASTLIDYLQDEQIDVRRRAMETFSVLMQKKMPSGGGHCLNSIDDTLKLRLFQALIVQIKKNIEELQHSRVHSSASNYERYNIIMQEQNSLFRILQYVVSMPKFLSVFCEYIRESKGDALHTIVHAIPDYGRQERDVHDPLNRETKRFLTHIFLVIHSIIQPTQGQTDMREFCRRVCHNPTVITRMTRIFSQVRVTKHPDQQEEYRNRRLKRTVVLCLKEALSFSTSNPESAVRAAVNQNFIENLLSGIDCGDDTRYLMPFLSTLTVMLNAPRRSKQPEPEKSKFVEFVHRRFLDIGGFRKVAKLVSSPDSKICENALLCMCYTGNHGLLRDRELSEVVGHLLNLISRLIQEKEALPGKVDPVGREAKRLAKILNKTLAVFGMICGNSAVKEQLSRQGMSVVCLKCVEQDHTARNTDGVESALIIMNNLLNEKNPQVTLVRDQIIQAPAGPRVLLDQLVAGEFANKKRAMNILCRLKTGSSESLGDSFCAAKSSDGSHDFATALVNLIGQFFDPCRHPCECPCRDYVDFLANAFQFLKTLALQSLVFLDHTVQRVRENNVIKHLCRCANPKVCQAIIDFATELGTRDYTLFSDLSSDHNFTMRLKQLQSIPELGRSAGELLSRIQNYSLNTDLASAMGWGATL
ncbi:hypothetical protein L596_017954 [Steinernema carpocapsae]|uniref:Armadillo repeat-containing domain-containing protein n=1 Tax=Steinernema carpocapsae TaxID=34508 RepID=A0A4U5N403_STECR|nr:hypothetical protein L596_017954 [Steinernema carpocapsae]